MALLSVLWDFASIHTHAHPYHTEMLPTLWGCTKRCKAHNSSQSEDLLLERNIWLETSVYMVVFQSSRVQVPIS